MKSSKAAFLLRLVLLILIASLVIPTTFSFSQEKGLEVAPGIPRSETLILEDPSGRSTNPGRFNLWGGGVSSWSTGLQQLALDALWYIDPDAGIEGKTWINSLAAEPPVYNKSFTKMTVKLRKGIYWSDGVEFTADDVVYTVKTLAAHPEMSWGAQMKVNVKDVSAPDKYTVVFDLTQPNSRFHTVFTVRWCGCYIMPKHIFEKQKDPVAFDFNPPVSLGPYVLKSYDSAGNWFLWERRQDWQRTTLGMYGMPAPKYVLYEAPGPAEKRVMAQLNHDLDVIHDIAPEGVVTLKKKNPTSVTWFDDFPWAHPDPTLPAVLLNHEKYPLNMKEVRWALTLAIDIVQVSLASYNGAATISAIEVPPTGHYLEWYFDPIQPWLEKFSIKVGGKAFYPYDSSIPSKIAEKAKNDLGYNVPTDPKEIKARLGYGWWKYAPDIAEKLLLSKGFKRDKNGKWLLPDGKPWKITILSEAEARPTMARAAATIAEQWRKFGIDAVHEPTDQVWTRTSYGDYDASLIWNVETWGGHPDLFWFLESWHSQYYRPSGQPIVAKNHMRWKNKRLDSIIDQLRRRSFDDPKCIDLGLDFIKLCVEEMPTIPLMSYNVFTVCDEYYWTGFPTAKDPYTDPVPNWANSKYMFVKIKPVKR